jgi:hypothetical protein
MAEEGDLCENCGEVNLRAVVITDKNDGHIVAKGLWCDACQILVEED